MPNIAIMSSPSTGRTVILDTVLHAASDVGTSSEGYSDAPFGIFGSLDSLDIGGLFCAGAYDNSGQFTLAVQSGIDPGEGFVSGVKIDGVDLGSLITSMWDGSSYRIWVYTAAGIVGGNDYDLLVYR